MSANQIQFTNQVVLITGAGRGLGRAYALEFAKRGARVVVHDAGVAQDGSGEDHSVANAVVAEIEEQGGSASASFWNLATKEGCNQLIDEVIRAHGRVDVLVSNAGIVRFIPDEDLHPQTADDMMAVNAMASLWLTLALKPHLIRQGYGRIVYTVSGHGTVPASEPNELTIYGMAKAAVFGVMNMSLAEFGDADVRLNAISPVAATRVLRRSVSGDELAAEKVVPAVIALASPGCQRSGLIISAADGRFSIRSMVTEHQLSPSDHDGTAESLWSNWQEQLGG